MSLNVYTISIAFSLVFLIVVVELVRSNKLQEKYSFLWLVLGAAVLLLSITPDIMETISQWLDIKNPPSLLFLFGLVYLLIYNLHMTTVVSRQSEKITRLVQELALLKDKTENQ